MAYTLVKWKKKKGKLFVYNDIADEHKSVTFEMCGNKEVKFVSKDETNAKVMDKLKIIQNC